MEVQEQQTVESEETASTSSDDQFIKHKVNKLDTLAGLAIRYNVSVADIKRANGLLSDTAMFARDTLLIPKHCLPVGEEVQLMFAQLVSGLGRDPSLNKSATLYPGTAAVVRLAGAGANDSPITNAEDSAVFSSGCSKWWCYCGECAGFFNLGGDQTRTRAGDQELELSDRGPESMYVPPGYAGSTRFDAAVRRRRRDDGDAGDLQQRYVPLLPKNMSAVGSTMDMSNVFSQLSSISKSIGQSELIQKIRRAVNQPALATAQSASFGRAADAVLASVHTPKNAAGSSSFTAQTKLPSPPKPKVNGKYD